MQKIFLLILLLLITNNIFSQSLIDTIITVKNDTISCQIKYVNNYNVFYSYKKKDKIKDEVISRLDVFELIVNNKNVTILEEKYDSHINGFIRKSTLNKKYDVLLLPDNTDPTLKILADSTFIFKKIDYFIIASTIQGFAKKYNCKLVHPSKMQNTEVYRVNIKLYDAPDSLYKSELNSYNQKKIIFLRTKNSFEPDEYTLNLNQKKFTIKKNDYYIFDLSKDDSTLVIKKGLDKITISDTISTNKYFFIGSPNQYPNFNPTEVFLIIGFGAIGGLVGEIVFEGISNGSKCKISNFMGEFMKMNIDEEKKKQ